MSTGLYNVSHITINNKYNYYEYKVRNRLTNTVIREKNPLILKMKVLEAGLLWGIVDIDDAIKVAKKHHIEVGLLQGRYGKQVNKFEKTIL